MKTTTMTLTDSQHRIPRTRTRTRTTTVEVLLIVLLFFVVATTTATTTTQVNAFVAIGHSRKSSVQHHPASSGIKNIRIRINYDQGIMTRLYAKRQQQQRAGTNKSSKKKNSAGPSSKKKRPSKKSSSKNPMNMSNAGAGPEGFTSRQPQKKQKQQHVAPPWQVVSQKDMKKNVEAEQARRSLAQSEGKHMSPQQIEETKSELQRSTAFLSSADKSFLGWKPFSLQLSHHKVDFLGAFLEKQMPPRIGAPEVAFLGRSNVGKSSLLNRLLGRSSSTDVARVGKTPGATASVNLYGIYEKSSSSSSSSEKNKNQKAVMGMVDLPGFGYAKLSKETQRSVQETAEQYLERRQELALGILLVDIRRVPTEDDKAVLAALFDMGVPIVVVATKVDKLSSSQKVDQALKTINVELGLPEGQPLSISSVTGQGVKDLWRIIMEACEDRVEELRSKIEGGGTPGSDEFDGSSFDEIKAAARAKASEYDEDEMAYSQGYDWIQGSSVMYEGDGNDEFYDDDNDRTIYGSNEDYEWDGDYDDDNDFEDNDEGDFDMFPVQEKASLKSLKRIARDLEKRGEI